ncbi:hypothetical protein ACFYKX_10915 [Cytobacillus sp. FJAT-54145]|uniref:Uncharacterized protein n=1 Tax=Cytobacillus spartinae TaxID=3299023 RepID=A0ABW6KA54_9BACI
MEHIALAPHVEEKLKSILEESPTLEKPRKTKRSRAYYRSQARTKYQHRKREAVQVFQEEPEFQGFSRHHCLGCSCYMCKWGKKLGLEKAKYILPPYDAFLLQYSTDTILKETEPLV